MFSASEIQTLKKHIINNGLHYRKEHCIKQEAFPPITKVVGFNALVFAMITKIKVKSHSRAEKILFFNEADLTAFKNPQIIPLFGANGAGKSTFLDMAASDLVGRIKLNKKIKRYEAEIAALQGEAEKPKTPMDAGDTLRVVIHGGFNEAGYRKLEEDQKAAFEEKKECLCQTETDIPLALKWSNEENNLSDNGFFSSNPYDMNRLSLYWDASSLSEGQSLIYSIKDFLDIILKEDSIYKDNPETVLLLDEIDSGLSIDNIAFICRKIKQIIKARPNVQIFMSFNSPEIISYFPEVLSMYDGKPHMLKTYQDFKAELAANKKMLDKARKNSRGEYRIYS